MELVRQIVAARRTKALAPIAAAVVVAAFAPGGHETGAASATRVEITHSGRGHDVHLSAPAVAVLPDGTPVVAWFAQDGHGNALYLARPSDAGGAPVRVNPGGTSVDALHQPPGISVGPRGEIYVTWSAQKPKPEAVLFASDLYLSRSVDGGRTFDSHLRINEDRPLSHSFEGVAVTPDGTLVVAWVDSREGPRRPRTWVARVVDRGARLDGSSVPLDPDETCVCCRIDVASDGDAVAVLWRKVFPGDIRDMVLATSRDGGRSFGSTVRVHTDGWKINACPHRGGRIRYRGQGRLVTAWYTEGPTGRPDVLFATSSDGRRFTAPRRLQQTTGTIPDHVRLAAGAGRVVVAWEEATAVRRRVIVRTSVDGGRTFGPIQMPSRALKASAPDVTAAPNGGFVLVWREEQFPVTKTVVQSLAVEKER